MRGARVLREDDREITVQVDHRTEGAVMNVIRPLSPTTIALNEPMRAAAEGPGPS
jgi:hypothetical protein